MDFDSEECDYALPATAQVCSEECRVRCLTNVSDTATDHTCQHVSFGPFGAVAANAHPGVVNSVISQTHVHFTVTMAKNDSEQTVDSAVNLFPIKTSSFALYLGEPEPVTLLDSEGREVPALLEAPITTCSAGLSRVQVHALDVNESYVVVFPADGAVSRSLVLEELGEHARFHSPDGDGDGFGSSESVLLTWCQLRGSGLIQDDRDCDDTRAFVFPGAAESCDGIDNDCDGNAEPDGAACEAVATTDVVPVASTDPGPGHSEPPDDDVRDGGEVGEVEVTPPLDGGLTLPSSNSNEAGAAQVESRDMADATAMTEERTEREAGPDEEPAPGAVAPEPSDESCGCTTVGARSRNGLWGVVGALVVLSCGFRRRVTGLRHRSVTSRV